MNKSQFKGKCKINKIIVSNDTLTSICIIIGSTKQVHPALHLNNMKEAINYSTKTSMLSMRMANLYGIQVLQGYPAEKKQIAKKQLKDAMRTTNDIYKALLTFAPVANQPKLKQKVKMSQDYWFQLEKKLSKKPKRR